MTEQRFSVSRMIFGAFLVFIVALFVKNSQLAIEFVNKGLLLCARVMIPTLFPFMVIAEIIVRSGVGEMLSRPLCRALRPALGVGEEGMCALTLGVLCGFPVGARTASAYYRNGKLSKRELHQIICCGNIPSSAFVVGAVGTGLFGDVRLGWILFTMALCAAFLTGCIFRKILPHGGNWDAIPSRSGKTTPGRETDFSFHLGMFSESVTGAASSMLNVCATVILFSALIGCLTSFCDALLLPPVVRTLVFGLFEMTTGVCEASALSGGTTALLLCAAFLGWAGLSVHCQIFSVCTECPLSLGWFWLSRLMQTGFCLGGMTLLTLTGMFDSLNVPRPLHSTFSETLGGGAKISLVGTVFLIFFLIASVAWIVRIRQRKRVG